jgi:hypothetical protein
MTRNALRGFLQGALLALFITAAAAAVAASL